MKARSRQDNRVLYGQEITSAVIVKSGFQVLAQQTELDGRVPSEPIHSGCSNDGITLSAGLFAEATVVFVTDDAQQPAETFYPPRLGIAATTMACCHAGWQ